MGITYSKNNNALNSFITGISMSHDGRRVVTSVYGGNLYVSEDSGATWTDVSSFGGPEVWTDFAISGDGSRLISCEGITLIASVYSLNVSSGSIFTSSFDQYNEPWTDNSGATGGVSFWDSCASDVSGQTLVVGGVGNTTGIVTASTDGGQSWTNSVLGDTTGFSLPPFTYVACSADGSLLAAAVSNSYIFTSTDGGQSWQDQSGSFAGSTGTWNSITVDASGRKLLAYDSDSSTVWASLDSGVTWIPQDMPTYGPPIMRLAISADGSTAYAANFGTIIFKGQATNDVSGWSWEPLLNVDNAICKLWQYITTDATGQTVAAITTFGELFISKDGGNSWTSNDYFVLRYGLWDAVAMSADGQLITACNDSGDLFSTLNLGTSWFNGNAGSFDYSQEWQSIAMSADGVSQVAAAYSGDIWFSTDSGATWTDLNSGPAPTGQDWYSIACNSDCSQVIGCVNGGDIWIGNPIQNTWTDCVSAPTGVSWTSVSSDATGQRLVACGNNMDLWVSNSSGAEWTDISGEGTPGTQPWTSVAMSSDGNLIIACASVGDVWIGHFADSGPEWTWTDTSGTTIGGQQPWYSVATDATGMNLFAAVWFGDIYYSNNYGGSWTVGNIVGSDGEPQQWQAITCSASGQYAAASVWDGGIYLSSDFGATWTRNTGQIVLAPTPPPVPPFSITNFISPERTGDGYTEAVKGLTIFFSHPLVNGSRGRFPTAAEYTAFLRTASHMPTGTQ